MLDLTAGASYAWQCSADEASRLRASLIEREHLLIGLCSLEKATLSGSITPDRLREIKTEQATIVHLFQRVKIDVQRFRRVLRSRLSVGTAVYSDNVIHRSTEAQKVFESAMASTGGAPVSALHLLNALLDNPGYLITHVLKRANADAGRIQRYISFPKGDDVAAQPRAEKKASRDKKTDKIKDTPEEGGGSMLEQFGRDLTAEAREGNLGEIIGRRKEILQTIQALARKKKNNPVIVGEAGVGKTAIVEALAMSAVQGKDPEVLGGKRIVELTMGSLLSGTKYRGDLEERMTKIIKEVSADPNLILFIDEIHTIMGAGGEHTGIANLMKPALARGQFKCIGATTIDEYRKYIEKDPAIERRFEKIQVDEPSKEETIVILKGLSSSLEKHHSTRYTDEAIVTAVDLSVRFDVDHRLPDKAIDLLDKAGARKMVSALSMGPRQVPGSEDKPKRRETRTEVTKLDVAKVLADKMCMPLEVIAGHIEGGGTARLLALADYLKEEIKGQDYAIDRLAERMMLAHSKVTDRRGPLAVLLFLGPSGVGKTEMAKQLALFLFGSEKNLIRFDMSEFKEEHSISKLIGSPPGYVGHDEDGQFTGQIRSKPYAVVLLDEVEKAHQRIYDVFLQVFDEGRITDAKGRFIDARNAIFILTTNVRPNVNVDIKTIAGKRALNEALKSWFRPELLNRIDEIVGFSALGEEHIRSILGNVLKRLSSVLQKEHGVTLTASEKAEIYLTKAGYDPEYGARELRRTVERLVQVPLSRMVLQGTLKEHDIWRLEVEDDIIELVPG